jgi:hypothetical protein
LLGWRAQSWKQACVGNEPIRKFINFFREPHKSERCLFHLLSWDEIFFLQPTGERRRTGSHYTPRSLTAPIGLLALFRLIHKGHKTGFVQARGGKLFDPDEFPFLEGRASKDDPARILAVSDGCLLRILEGLMTLNLRGAERERLSYRTLDVEQIGSVYETVMGFTVEAAGSRVLAIKAGKNNKTPVFVALDELLAKKGKDRIKDLKENVGRALTAAQGKPVEEARSVEDLVAALDGMVDERGSPKKRIAAWPADEGRSKGDEQFIWNARTARRAGDMARFPAKHLFHKGPGIGEGGLGELRERDSSTVCF